MVIKGYSKSAGYQPGVCFEDNRFRNSWNAVYVAGAWRFVQCNWGARHLVNAKEVPRPGQPKAKNDSLRYFPETYLLFRTFDMTQFFFNYSTCSTPRSSQIRIRRSLFPDRPARVHLRVLPPSRGVAIAQTTDFAQRFRRAAFRAFIVLQVMQLLRQILVKKLNSLIFLLNKVAYPTISLKLFIAYTIDHKYLNTCGYLVRIECYSLLLFFNFL